NEVHLERFSQVPFLTKQIIREQGRALISEDCPRRGSYPNTSGGSTGEPVRFLQDARYKAHNWADVLLYNRVLGKELGMREVKLWGSERDILQGGTGWITQMGNFLYNRLLLNSFLMTPDLMREYVSRINHFKPYSLWTYVESAFELARFVDREKLSLVPIPVTITTAGTLTESVREFIEKHLQTKVHNQYGSREVGPIACECPMRNGLHLFEWTILLETVDEKGQSTEPGKEGEIVVTLLSNYSMPLIRYRIGDRGTLTERSCPCGRQTRLLETVSGRIVDHFRLSDETLVGGEYFTHLLYHRPWVQKFQFVQDRFDHVSVYLVVEQQPQPSELDEIRSKVQVVMGKQCEVTFQFVEEVPPTTSGKRRYTVCAIAKEQS
ncbi:MAG TPA: phenylacetate--CoA ligase family protein, partial [bacterium]|nr:phenylacetate--CoA ligase family protein [bacterium]